MKKDKDTVFKQNEFYKKRIEELTGDNLKFDIAVSGLRHELRQRRQSFALLAQLHKTIGIHSELNEIFRVAIEAINPTLKMDKTVVLKQTEKVNVFKPGLWLGFQQQYIDALPSHSFEFPKEFSEGTGCLVVNKWTQPTNLIKQIQSAFNLPFFICIPVMFENAPLGLLLSGRIMESKPFYPPLEQGDVDTFQAIADLITATVRNRRHTVLKEIDKLKTEFFTNISHEFRTPLTLILGPAKKLTEENLSEKYKEDFNIIYKNAQRLLRLINQLLDLSKLDSGKLNLKASKGNIIPFVKGLLMSFESLAEQRDITLKFTSATNEVEIYFDKDKMIKIITNLLSNAFKFTGVGGEIKVSIVCHSEFVSESMSSKKMLKPASTAKQGEQVQHDETVAISVKDTGIGISETEISKLFDRFYQVDSSQTREHEGSGIGLALTKELIELHKGKITVKSKKSRPGKVNSGWTEFTILLPAGKNHLSDDEIITEPEISTDEFSIDTEEYLLPESEIIKNDTMHDGKEKTIILIVEDNPDMRSYIRSSLVNEFQVEEAANGEQGFRKATKIIPDLIISDVMMPKMDGNELTRIIKNDERTSHIPVILLTARSRQESKLEGLKTGADDYLTKPFDTKELIVRINNLIEIRRKLQEKYSKSDFLLKKKKLSTIDEKFMSKVIEVIENHLSDEDFDTNRFSREVGMSRVQLYRKLKALSGKSASHYIRSVRLQRAKIMIEERTGNILKLLTRLGLVVPHTLRVALKMSLEFFPEN